MSRASTQQDSSGSGDEDWAPSAHADSPDGASSEGVRRCKVDGCGLDLTHHKTFFRRARCCPTHARELTVHLGGQAKRLCQQCSAYHLLADFDGTKRSCRTRLESHKIRQREHNNRRMAQAAAALQQKAAAETSGSPLPPAASGVQIPAAGGGHVQTGAANAVGQQMGASAPWAPLQQPALWQQAPQAPHALTPHQAAPQPPPHPMAAQQQQQQPLQQGEAGVCDAPSIFADVPLDKLPVDMHPASQPSWDQSPVDVYNLSSFWEGPPPQGCQAFGAGTVGCTGKAPSIGEMDLRQPLPLIELFGSAGLTPRSVRSMSADAGAACFGGWGGAAGHEAVPSRLGGTGRRDSLHSSASQLLSLGSDPLAVEARCDSAFEAGRRHSNSLPYDALESPFERPFGAPTPPLQRHAGAAAPGGRAALKRSAPGELPGVESLRTRSVKRPSLNSYEPPDRETFTTAKYASLGFLRTDSASEGGGFSRLGDCVEQLKDLRRCALLDGRGAGARSPCGSLHSTESDPALMGSSRRRSAMSEFARSSAPLPSRSVNRPSLDVLPDGAPQDYCSTDFGDRAFEEQAPDPLYLAAQLVREAGLPPRRLPEFSYGASRSASSSPGAIPRPTAALPPLRSCNLDSAAADEIGRAALKALVAAEGAAAFDDVSERLQQLACSYKHAPPAMGRRIRRRSADEGARRNGLLSLVA